ncbi:S49 family peptidase [Limobrevibacterium gyesilva]|uniref:S49 family peptidase n=1 Tax=Limobrevibacterium gyesilva TaxID=2991712 RepID=A0AA41YP98_9PROT|nr:S49 family peptidase [Limobrevibacterium gyesilva]MCW3477204.1 S49 family peptidase [Limobrevibacterium gyesilva]
MRLLFWRRRRIPVLVLHGILATRGGALNLDGYARLIDRAFAAGKDGHVILDINSPGGSPVQSDLLAARIRRAAEENNARVLAVIGDVGASGGYWLACAADEILANPMSVVGSIGVVGGGFGFEDAITRLGVRRRLYTAGENKARLDPFSPERPQDIDFVRTLMDDIHARFKDWVRTRRAGKLTADEASLFDGSFMLGSRAKDTGLIDRFGDIDSLVREIGGKKARPQTFRPRRRSLLARLPRTLVEAALDVAEERQGVRARV